MIFVSELEKFNRDTYLPKGKKCLLSLHGIFTQGGISIANAPPSYCSCFTFFFSRTEIATL